MLSVLQKRFLLFFTVCVGIRLSFVFIAKKINSKYLHFLGLLGLIPVFAFSYRVFISPRNKGIFGTKAWWAPLRIVHAFNYLVFSILAFNKNNYAYVPLLFDIILGIVAFLSYNYSVGAFGKLLK